MSVKPRLLCCSVCTKPVGATYEPVDALFYCTSCLWGIERLKEILGWENYARLAADFNHNEMFKLCGFNYTEWMPLIPQDIEVDSARQWSHNEIASQISSLDASLRKGLGK